MFLYQVAACINIMLRDGVKPIRHEAEKSEASPTSRAGTPRKFRSKFSGGPASRSFPDRLDPSVWWALLQGGRVLGSNSDVGIWDKLRILKKNGSTLKEAWISHPSFS